jgi:hypothetical protein
VAVRQKIPALLVIHSVFLLFVFLALTAALSVRSHLSPSWISAKGKRDSWFDILLMVFGVTICMIQTLISRKILRRSIDTAMQAR